jgi:zinc D-Ala-D-Ala carboxypeptidase
MTKNFTLAELIYSRTAVEQDIREQFKPNDTIKLNLRELAVKCLQPLRNKYGRAIHVNSGYRCKRLNEAVGGSKTSDHMKGMAADITCDNARELYDLASLMNLPFKQLIYYADRNFVHISYDANNIKKQKWEQ